MFLAHGLGIVMVTKPVDFRKSHDGLVAVVEEELGLDPYSGVAHVFRSRTGYRIKVLWFDGTGLVLWYKRLERGRFVWPRVSDDVLDLTQAQFESLCAGLDWYRERSSADSNRGISS